MVPPRITKIDCHIHSEYSPDGRGSLQELAAVARQKGISGFAVTDHNSLRMAAEMKNAGITDLTLIPGMEVSTKDGHCLALGVREPVPRHLTLAETLERIVQVGGLGVPSHPYRRVHGAGELAVLAARSKMRAIEVYNARDGKKSSNLKAQNLAHHQKLGGTGGSDAHGIQEVGNAYTRFRDPVESVDDFLDQLSKGKTWGHGVPTPRRIIFKQNLKNVGLFVRRGFRSI